MSEVSFEKVDYGFWKQLNPTPIDYSVEYKEAQQTTVEMSWLRLGLILSLTDKTDNLTEWKVCDVGSGNGCFAKEASKVFGYVAEYDLSGNTISEEELYNTYWDLIVLSDVLEHYQDINDLFKIKTDRIMLSFPEAPKVDRWEELKDWRHFKPNEHIWMLNGNGVYRWLRDHGWTPMLYTHAEDVIRRGDNKPNTTTIIAYNTVGML